MEDITMSTKINICFATDNNYISHTATTMASVLSNAAVSDEIIFYIPDNDISEENKQKIEQLKTIRDFNVFYPPLQEGWGEMFKNITRLAHINMNTYIRCIVPQLCPSLDRVIYLDSDLLVLGSLAELATMDLKGYYFAAVEDVQSEHHAKKLGFKNSQIYFNAGVLVVNCASISQKHEFYMQTMQKRIQKRGHKYTICDQDVMNDSFQGLIEPISYRWNFHHLHHGMEVDFHPLNQADYDESCQNPTIIHFIMPTKPWTAKCTHPDRRLYFDYRAKTPWDLNGLVETLGQDIKPAFPDNNSILVFFACDKKYVPLLHVAIVSLVSNTKKNHNYDIVILESGLSEFQKIEILACADSHKNISIRFVNMSQVEQEMKLGDRFYARVHFAGANYWRTFAPYLFQHYDSALYLDVDIIVEEDVFELGKYNLGDNLLGACRDLYAVRFSQINPNFFETSIEPMELNDVSDYFNSGVLLMNLAQMRKEDFRDKLAKAHDLIKHPYCVDQDILNDACKNRVTYLDPAWNYMEWNVIISSNNKKMDMSLLEEQQYALYLLAKNARPKIIHYASNIKPPLRPDIELSQFFWKYARKTCWYEKFIYDMTFATTAWQINNKMGQINNSSSRQAAPHGFRSQRLLLYMADRTYQLMAAITPQAVKPMLRVPHQKLSQVWRKVRKRLQ